MSNLSRSILLASLSAVALASPAAVAAQTPPVPAATPPSDDPGNTIVVTGTRRTDRTVADSPVPIDVIGGEALTNTGLTETNKILNQLVPSFNFPQPSIADGTDVLRPATLRGLSPDQTLVLINGKRRHVSALLNINGTVGRGSAAVDLNLVPTLAIERIEVLRDGASSQYGSDAIAGVINIQLKKAKHGGRAVASYGKYYTTINDTDNFRGLQTNGAGQPITDPADPRIFLANSSGELKARDGAMTTLAANIGVPIGAGYINLTGEYRDRNPTNRSGFDLRPQYNKPGTSFDPRELTFDRRSFLFGDAKTEDFNLFANAGVPLGGSGFDLYAFGSFSHRDGLSAANYRPAGNSATLGFNANRDFSVLSPSTPTSAANFVPLTPDGFLPMIETKTKDWAATVGAKGELVGWNADFSLGYGHDEVDFRTLNSINTSFGTASKRDFDDGQLAYGQYQANLDFQRQFALGLASPVSVAIGAEYRDENYKITPGELQSYSAGPLFRGAYVTTSADCATQGGVYNAANRVCSFPGRTAPAGAQGFGGLAASSAADESRRSQAVYGELDSDVAKGLTVQVAGRFEHFSDFGNTTNGKIALRYEVAPGYAVRGSASTGFRAPSLHQQFFANTATNFLSGVAVDTSTVPVESPVARALGAKPLKPEKSRNLSVGATANPLRGLTLTADYYNIRIKDRIVLTENLQASRDAAGVPNGTDPGKTIATILNANGFGSVGAARFFINGIDTTTRGIDLIGTYRWRAGDLGTWNLTAAYNHTTTKIDKRLSPLSTTIPGLVLLGRQEGLRFTDGQPKSKIVLSADGEIRDFGLTARTTRYGKVVALEATRPLAPDAASLTALGPDDQILSAKWITDLELRYKLLGRVGLAVGANNLFDVYPDRRPFGKRPDGGNYPQNFQYIPYSASGSPFGFNGRFLYGRVSVDF
ncbi:MAG: TonB-dependent receptor [Sphingomonas sp.]|nr:TonB-dependent receptor [Sphingomonas sp.]